MELDKFYTAVVDTVAEYSLENTSIKKISQHGGFSEALIYRHFTSVEDLYAKTYDYVWRKHLNMLKDKKIMEQLVGETDPTTIMKKILRVYYEVLYSRGNYTLFSIAYRHSHRGSTMDVVERFEDMAKDSEGIQPFHKMMGVLFKSNVEKIPILLTFMLDNIASVVKHDLTCKVPIKDSMIDQFIDLIINGVRAEL